MPRGSNPNSKKALAENRKKTQFCGETAVKAQKKSAEVQRYNGVARRALKDKCTDDKLTKILDQLERRALSGNLTAIKMILDYTDEKQEQTVNNEITINLKKDDWDEYSN